jgi:hypothetical protein
MNSSIFTFIITHYHKFQTSMQYLNFELGNIVYGQT